MDYKSEFHFTSIQDLEQRNSLVSVIKSLNNFNQQQDQIYPPNQYYYTYSQTSQHYLYPIADSVQYQKQKSQNLNKIESNKILRSDSSLQTQKLNSVFERQMLQSITTNLRRVQLKLGINSRNQLLSIDDADQDDNSCLNQDFQGPFNQFDVCYSQDSCNDFKNERLEQILQNFNQSQSQQDRCSICLNSYNESDEVRILKCKHFYHSLCLKDWLERDNRCPLCKSIVKFQQKNLQI